MRKLKEQRGLSLIEVTIMLLVLMLLTSVLAPSIFDFVVDAQWVKVKEDCEVLAISVARLVRDVGPNLYTKNGGQTAYLTYKMDLMLSDGRAPAINLTLAPPVTGFTGGLDNWYATTGTTTSATSNFIGTCEQQLISNLDTAALQIYLDPATPTYGPFFGQGWRGAYLSPPCASDPWGRTYEVNTKWINTSFGTAGTPVSQFHCNDVYCLSAGKNGIIETPFGTNFATGSHASGTRRGGDDWTTVIAPCDP